MGSADSGSEVDPHARTAISPGASVTAESAPPPTEPPPAARPTTPLCPLCMHADPGPGRCDLRTPGGGRDLVRARRLFFVFGFLDGFREVFRALVSVMHGQAYVGRLILPIAANIVAVAAVAAAFFLAILPFFTWLVAQRLLPIVALTDIGEALGPAIATEYALAIVATMHTATTVLVSLTAPFLDEIAGATERDLCAVSGRKAPPGLWESVWRGTHTTARILGLQLVLLPIGLVLSLLGMWFCLLALALAAFLNATVWLDLPCTRRGYEFDQRLALAKHNWGSVVGFGFAFQLVLMLPFANMILLPATAVGATRLFYRLDKTPIAGAAPMSVS